MPLEPEGDFASGLSRSRQAALELYERVKADHRFQTILTPSLDILVWAPSGTSASQISARSEAIFKAAADVDLHLAIFKCPASLLRDKWPHVNFDRDEVVCLRSCLMKPEHLDWIDPIWEILDQVVDEIRQ
jgi:hypothetical protein